MIRRQRDSGTNDIAKERGVDLSSFAPPGISQARKEGPLNEQAGYHVHHTTNRVFDPVTDYLMHYFFDGSGAMGNVVDAANRVVDC